MDILGGLDRFCLPFSNYLVQHTETPNLVPWNGAYEKNLHTSFFIIGRRFSDSSRFYISRVFTRDAVAQ